MLLDKPLKLCAGSGNGVDTACLMTATNMLIGKPERGDAAVCVCPVLRSFIIVANDVLPDAMRQEYLGPLPWVIIGTNVNDPEVSRLRAEYMLGMVKGLVSIAIRDAQPPTLPSQLYTLPSQYTPNYAYNSLDNARDSIATAERHYQSGDWLGCAARCAITMEALIQNAIQMRNARGYNTDEKLQLLAIACRDIIVGAAAIGSKTPVELVMTPDQLCEALK